MIFFPFFFKSLELLEGKIKKKNDANEAILKLVERK